MSLALWLRAGRAQKGLSLEQVAKITKIQPRILERLEAGKLEGLPAEVFVRGFVRSVAKCVGLSESEAVQRYSAATGAPSTIPTARAFVEQMAELAPDTATSVLAPVVLISNPILPLTNAPNGSMSELVAEDAFDDVEIHVDEPVMLTAPVVEPVVEAVVEAVVVAPVVAEVVVETAPLEAAAIEVVEAPIAEAPIVEAAPEVVETGKKKRTRKPRGTAAPKGKRKAMATGTPSQPTPVIATEPAAVVEAAVVDTAVAETPVVAEPAQIADATAADELFGAPAADPTELVDAAAEFASLTASHTTVDTSAETVASETTDSTDVVASSGTWKPSMPTVTTSSVPWRRPALGIYATATSPVIPSLVIDDADPDSAEREIEDRAQAKEPARKSFLPPILAERAKNAASGQGTLTLAVIILLIAATLTLSYLMRRPSSSGDGVTRLDGPSDGVVELVG